MESAQSFVVVGGGTMGRDIAAIFHAAGWRVQAVEPDAAARASLAERVRDAAQAIGTPRGPGAVAVLEALDAGTLGNTAGYSGHMRAFARQAVAGLWLTGFSIESGGRDLGLSGRALRAELVPAYLRGLNREEARGRPFLVALGLAKPHLRWVFPRKYLELYPLGAVSVPEQPADDVRDIPAIAVGRSGRNPPGLLGIPSRNFPDDAVRRALAAHNACVSFVDAQIGRVLDVLDRRGLWETTTVVLVGDHGFHLGEHGGIWGKDTLFEESVRVPLIIASPEVSQPGVPTSGLAELVDVFPTLVELAGLPHNGFLNSGLICHLPLIVPPRCYLRVGNHQREWREGRAWVFDDSIEHEAYNPSTETRVILLFEIWRPELTAEGRDLVAALLEAMDTFGSGPRVEWSA